MTTPRTAAAAAVPPPGAGIIKEKIPAPADTDRATTLTVKKMCEYILAGAADPLVQAWAAQARDQYAAGGTDAQAICWGVWWMAKHRVRFAKDEPRLMGIGDGDALDLLIAPAVLVRQKDPAGDCDDFTMLICAMLTVLGVPWNIVTIACEPSDPTRWSHVFPVALLGKDSMPMDASHGKYPGWRVPSEHTFRWQAFNSRAQRVDRKPVRFYEMHGYTPRRASMIKRSGMGQACTAYDADGNCIAATATSNPYTPTESPYPVVTLPGGGGSGTGFNWNSALASILGNAANVATVAELPAGSAITRGGIYTGGPTYGAEYPQTSSVGGMLPLLLIAGVGILLLSSAGKR